MTKEETVAAMAQSPGWLQVQLVDPSFVELAADTVLLSYEFRGERAAENYEARLSSIYRRTADGWRMIFHQQTPAP